MRTLKEIKDDISKNKKKDIKLKEKKKKAVYSTTTNVIGYGVRLYIWSLISGFFAFFAVGLCFEEKIDKDSIAVSGVLSLAFMTFAIIAAVRYLIGNISFSAARVFTIISGVIFIVPLIEFIFNLSGSTLAFLFAKDQDQLVEWIEIPYDCIIKTFACTTGAFMLPIGTILIGSLVKMINENKKIHNSQAESAKLEIEIADCQNKMSALNDELKSTEQEAQSLLEKEISKDEPDLKQMEFLATIGVPTAKEWVIGVHRKMFNEEIKNSYPDIDKIKRAADFECPEASLYYAKWLFRQYTKDITKDDNTLGNKEKKELCLTAQPYFKTAALAGNAEAKAYYYYTIEILGVNGHSKYGCTYAYNWDELCMLRDKLQALIDSNMLDDYTTILCQKCIGRIEMGLMPIRDMRDMIRREKAGFYSDLGSYQAARAYYSGSSSSSSNSNSSETTEFYYPIDVSGM